MGSKRLARRLLSMLLALQLLFSQLPVAFASSMPEGEGSTGMTEQEADNLPAAQPDGEEEQNTTPPSETTPTEDVPSEEDALLGDEVDQQAYVPLMYSYMLGYGVDISAQSDTWLNEYSGYFAVETATGAGYGARDYTGASDLPFGAENGSDYYTFCVFPNQAVLGRVPDKQFEGWYICPPDMDKDNPRSWSYASALDPETPLDAIPYGAGDLGYTDWGHLGDTWNGKQANYSAYGYGAPEMADIFAPVCFVGKWSPSKNALAFGDGDKGVSLVAMAGETEASTQPKLYDAPVGDKPLTDAPVTFSPDETEYWLRVGADVDSLNLTFNASEPYYSYNAKGQGNRPVSVTCSYDGVRTDYSNSLQSQMLPAAQKHPDLGINVPQNSLTDPAHSQWTAQKIALGASKGTGKLYNDIYITVTAPDGVTKTEYVFHVQRLAEPTLARNPGNTPYGMIARDTSVVWGTTAVERAANKELARRYFATNHLFDPKLYPQDAEHNGGGNIFRGNYGSRAWRNEANVDLDPNALVVYQDAAFLDPGIALTDAQGNAVTLGTGAYAGTVRRTLKLRTMSKLTLDGVKDGGGQNCWYSGGTLSNTETDEALLRADGSDQINLRGLKVLPGIYSLEYSYTDPVSGITYDSTGNGFTDPLKAANKDAFRRTLVVLPAPGDVDMDGAVTAADAAALRSAVDVSTDVVGKLNGVDLGTDSTAALFAYRVCDLTRSNTIEVDDLEQLEKGFSPQMNRNGGSDYYYLPLPTGESVARYTRKALDTTAEENAAQLTLKFMGKEKGKHLESGATSDPQGPDWTAADTEGVTLGDTFWLGVKLTDSAKSALLNQSVNTFTFSLTYDARYVTPAVVLDESNWNNAGSEYANRWKTSMRMYNLGAKSQTVWGSGYGYDLTAASGDNKEFSTHYSKAITPLEQNAGESTQLKELVFSIKLNNGMSPAGLHKDGWLLVVPFTLVKHPYGQSSARLVEMGAGMREFVFVGTQTGFSLMDLFMPRSAAAPTAAYSTQDEIFGGATANLQETVRYQDAAGADIPLGKDKTETTTLYNELAGGSGVNAVYSTQFEARRGVPMTGTVLGQLPPGLEYDGFHISGIPTKAGKYDFSITGTAFRIVVEQAPVRFWADNQATYYGQPDSELRGEQNPDFTFRYNTEDIMDIDRNRANKDANDDIVLDGNGANLAKLLDDSTYSAPAFTAVTADGNAIRNSTPVGRYDITCPLMPKSNNYKFEYTPDAATGNKGVVILHRPFSVVKLSNGTVIGEIYSDEVGTLTGREAVLSKSTPGFVVELPHIPGQPEGTYKGRPLTPIEGYLDKAVLPTDELTITYTGEYIRTPTDIENPGNFTLAAENPTEKRNVKVRNLVLSENKGAASNYILVGDAPTKPVVSEPEWSVTENGVTGLVTRRNIESINISRTPPMVYRHGDQLIGANELRFYIRKSGDTVEGQYTYNKEECAKMGIMVTWATEEDKAAKRQGDLEYAQGQVFDVANYNGRYLCVSAWSKNDKGEDVLIVKYSETKLKITPLTLTLTAKPVERYYGEGNGTLEFEYDPGQLATVDKDRLQKPTKDGAELLIALAGQGYNPPDLKAVVSTSKQNEPVDERTPYTGSKNAIIISNAKCDNYVFEYVRSNGSVSADWGDATLTISQRLIVVDSIKDSKKDDLVTIYADTKRIYTEKLPLALDQVEVSLPEHTTTTTKYFPIGGTTDSKPLTSAIGYAADASAILPADRDKLSLTYTATVVPTDGPSYIFHTDFAKGYYNMNDAGDDGEKEYPVQVSKLALAGAAAGNYTLVYKGSTAASDGLPEQTVVRDNCVLPEVNNSKTYYLAGTGKVVLRPIESITIVNLPKMTFTYGDMFVPTASNEAKQLFRVALNYASDPKIENYAGNTTSEPVDCKITSYVNGKPVNTFDERSLVVYWLKPGTTSVVENQTLTHGQYLTVTEHNGARLVVAGRRGQNDPLIQSQPTTSTLKVSPLPLALTADDASRCYGEADNPASFTFTFDESKLAKPDRDVLTQANLTGQKGAAALEKIRDERHFAYTAPTGSTTATQGSNVKDGGAGSYPISFAGGALDNYTLTYNSGALHIYPRPVKIERFISSYPDKDTSPGAANNPIYTIYSDTTARNFTTTVAKDRFVLLLGSHSSSGGNEPTGTPIYGDDALNLKIVVYYKNLKDDVDLKNESGKAHEVTVQSAAIVPGTAAATNYVLEVANGAALIMESDAIGAVELRSIKNIAVKTAPKVADYTYGQALNLSGLIVTIDYDIISGESNKQQDIVYTDTDQFAQHGLYVHYTDTEVVSEPWPGMGEDSARYRKAETGDHLTVAPTHDTQGTSNPFTANGKHLIISAQRHEEQSPAAPKVVPNYKITVAPLPLEFALSAGDKTYDGDTKAVGTLELKNVFRSEGWVDAHNQSGVTDMVYPMTKASYETTWSSLSSGYTNFKTYLVDKGGYVFTTGTYVPAGAAPLGENLPLRYTEGYNHGTGLTFRFLDPNVAYQSAPTHDNFGALDTVSVEATNIVLAGPDADNYTIVGAKKGETTAVTAENAATAVGYQGGALPKATIHKANRATVPTDILPKVELDNKTGVLRLTYPQSTTAISKGEAEDYKGELHFEYALQYDTTTDGKAAIAQFAGMNGMAEWWDQRFFGGEAYSPTVPEGYVPQAQDIPKEEDIKEDTVLKGQLYRWSEEDGGFVIDADAYPGGAVWPGYYLYKTDRSPLPRNAVLIPIVRAAETHNYNASPILSATTDYTPELAQDVVTTKAAVAVAEEKLAEDPENETLRQALEEARSAAVLAAEAALNAVSTISDSAKAAARAEVEYLQALAEDGKWPEDGAWPTTAETPAVKSYTQRIDVVSTSKKQGEGQGERKEYTVPILEAVYFTDILDYPEEKYLDVVLRNNDPTRFYRYAWDSAFSAELKFDDKENPFSLRDPIEVEIKAPGADGKEETEIVTVNSNNTAHLYADLSSGDNLVKERSIQIEPRSILAAVGDAPRQLTVTITPKYATYKKVTWTTSDPAVATVDKDGVVTFVGPGVATITATSRYKKTDSITVTVIKNWRENYPDAIFDLGYLDAFFHMEENVFGPENGMTRGEAVELLAQFYVPNERWKHTGTGTFPDLTGSETYAEAAKLLGSLGVVTGAPDGSFGGERPITRAEFVVLLTRMLGLQVPDTKGQTHAFLDSGEKDTWAYAHIDALSVTGILSGVGKDSFAPNRPITRVEAATFLARILRDGVDTTARSIISPGDVREDYWGYASILRAVNGAEPKKP